MITPHKIVEVGGPIKVLCGGRPNQHPSTPLRTSDRSQANFYICYAYPTFAQSRKVSFGIKRKNAMAATSFYVLT